MVSLPLALVGWTGTDGRAETVIKGTKVAKLRFKDWVPKATPVPASQPGPIQSAADDQAKLAAQAEKIAMLEKQLA